MPMSYWPWLIYASYFFFIFKAFPRTHKTARLRLAGETTANPATFPGFRPTSSQFTSNGKQAYVHMDYGYEYLKILAIYKGSRCKGISLHCLHQKVQAFIVNG
jgi:hypothetical protein